MSIELSSSSTQPLRRFALMVLVGVFSIHGLYAQKTDHYSDKKSTFTAKLMNLKAPRSEMFRYSASLHSGLAKAAVYELVADLKPGWLLSYRVDGSQVTSLNVDAGATKDIFIEVNAAADALPGKYPISVRAIAGKDTLTLNLEAVVEGSYSVTLTTPSGRLSDELTSGSTKQIQLEVRNTGTLDLEGLTFTSQLPTGWECTFEPANVVNLKAGKSIAVNANLKAPDKTIAGDYACTLSATTKDTNVHTSFRLQVKTSLLAGWVGILMILLAIGIVYYLIRRYGRR